MLLKHLIVQRFLSFDHDGIDLEMRDLNVLIGPNGSGKSNLLEVLAVLRALPSNFGERFKLLGPTNDWAWRATMASGPSIIKAHVDDPETKSVIMHVLNFDLRGDRCELSVENIWVTPESDGAKSQVYKLEDGLFSLWASRGEVETGSAINLNLGESILSQVRDPQGRYPFLRRLDRRYSEIWLHRGWVFGPSAAIRLPQAADARADHLADAGENLPIILSRYIGGAKRQLTEELRKFLADVQAVETTVQDGSVQVFLDEGHGREIPAKRLSDGTLRYLGLLAILLDPNPPALVAIEEPELGLHPDVLPGLGKLIKEASSRMQIFITTHSQVLLDAFSKSPEDVIVCSRGATGSKMERLSKEKLEVWLKDHTLGELWNMGEIGGNRW